MGFWRVLGRTILPWGWVGPHGVLFLQLIQGKNPIQGTFDNFWFFPGLGISAPMKMQWRVRVRVAVTVWLASLLQLQFGHSWGYSQGSGLGHV